MNFLYETIQNFSFVAKSVHLDVRSAELCFGPLLGEVCVVG